MTVVEPSFPGAEIVEQGLEDLHRHERSSAALALQVIAPRLRLVGFEVPTLDLDVAPEVLLYLRLSEDHVMDPYSSYNAMLRRLCSFAAAAEAMYYRELRSASAVKPSA